MTNCETKLNNLSKKVSDVDAKITDILNNQKVSALDNKKLQGICESIDSIKAFCKKNPTEIKEDDVDKLSNIINSIDTQVEMLRLKYQRKNDLSDNGSIKNRVNSIIKPEEQKKSTQNNRQGCLTLLLKNNLITLITFVLCTVAINNNINEWKEQKEDGITDKNYIDWNFTRSKAWISGLFGSRSIDLTDEEQVENVALDIQEALADEGIDMTTDEIIEAIYLLNFNEAMPTFDDANSILRATVNGGKIISTTGSGSIVNTAGKKNYFIPDANFEAMLKNVTGGKLTTIDFEGAKKVGGYDIYIVLDILVDGLKKDDGTEFYYAKLFNEIVTNAVNNFTILETAPVETMYAILGTYNANRQRIKELTHGRNLGPIYGSAYEIDGTYGNICSEEIDEFVYIKKDGSTYSADEGNMYYNAKAGYILGDILESGKSR